MKTHTPLFFRSRLAAAAMLCLLGGILGFAPGADGAITTFEWNGTTSTDWATGTNWLSGTAASTSGTYDARLNVYSGTNQTLTYSSTEGATVYANSTGRGLVIGNTGFATGSMLITGGTFSTLGSTQGDVIGNVLDGTLTVSGGSFIGTDAGTGVGINATAGTSILTVSGSGSATVATLTLGALNSVVNLNTGGTLAANSISSGTGTSTFNFNGGTLVARTGTTAFMAGLTNAYVMAGGAKIDTAGNNITIGQALLTGTANYGGLTKSGSGTLELTGANTLTGNVTVNQGELYLNSGNNAHPLGTNGSRTITIASGATLSANGDNPFSTGANAPFIVVNGTMKSARYQHMNSFDMTAGTITPYGSEVDGLAMMSAATVHTYAASGTSTIASKMTIASGNVTFNVEDGSAATDLLYSGQIVNASSNTSGILKTGSGTLTLTGLNTYTGGTVITGGTVQISGASADNGGYTNLGTGAVTINNGGTLLSVGNWTTGNEWNGGNVGTITVNAGGTWTMNNGTAGGTVRNGLVLNGGTVNGAGSNADWGVMYLRSTYVTAGGTATSTISVDTAMNGVTTMTVDQGSQLDYSGTIHNKIGATGGITKSGSGTLTLSGNNTYTGTTTVNAGTLAFTGGTSSIGAINANAGSTVFSGGNTTINGNLNLNADNSGSGLLFSGGVVTMNQLSSWVTDGLQFTIASGAEVHASAGVYCRSWRGASGMYLNGGTLYTAYLAGNASTTYWLNDNAYIHFNGTTIVATVDQSDFIQLAGGANYGNENFARLNATTTFDTAGYNIGIGVELRGAGGLTKSGSGTMTLSGNNTYTGATTISNGTLQIGNGADAGTIGSSSSITNDGSLVYNVGAGSRTYSGIISGTGSLTQNSAGGILALSGSNSYSGGTAVNVGVLTFRNTDAKPASGTTTVAAGATLGLGVAASGAFFTSADVDSLFANTMPNVSMDATSNVGIDTSAENFTYATSGSGSPTNGLVKLGANTLTLTGSSTHTGATTIRAGTLQIGDGTDTGSIASSSSITINGALVYNVGAGSRTYANSIDGNGSLTQNSSGGTLNLTGNNSYAGTTTVSAGTLDFSGTNTIGAVTANGGNVSFTGGNTTINGNLTQAQDSGNAINITNSVVTMNQLRGTGQGNGGLAFTIGAGTDVTASGGVFMQTYRGSGGMILNGGTLRTPLLSANSASGPWWINDLGYIHFNGTTIVATANQNNFIQLAAGANYGNENFAKLNATTTFDTAGYNIGIGVELRGSGGLTKSGSGTMTLTGANTYTGATTIISGTLQIGDGTDAGSIASSSSITNDGSLVYDVGAGSRTYANVISGTGSLTQNSAGGTLTLSGSNNYTGLTAVNNGTLKFDVSETLLGGLNIATSGTAVLTAHTGTVKVLDITGLTISGTTAFAGGGGKNLGELATPAAAPVPEPGTIGLLAAGALSIFLSRCRRK